MYSCVGCYDKSCEKLTSVLYFGILVENCMSSFARSDPCIFDTYLMHDAAGAEMYRVYRTKNTLDVRAWHITSVLIGYKVY